MIVFICGCFDVLHVDHIRLLAFAKGLGGELIVGIDNDERVKFLKGANRPIFNVHERKEMLLALRSVDTVISFDSEHELEALIKGLEPDIRVIGSDYEGKKIVGKEYCKKVVYYPRSGNSTTKTLQSISSR